MKEPHSVDVLHDDDGETWISDKFVLVRVTGWPCMDGVDAGWYSLQMNKGLVSRDVPIRINLPAYLGNARRPDMYPVCPVRLSITDHPAKAMIAFVEIPFTEIPDRPCLCEADGGTPCPTGVVSPVGIRYPLAINEKIWLAFRKQYPDMTLWHSGFGGSFRVAVPNQPEFAYIEPIRIPVELQPIVIAAVDAASWEGKEDDNATDVKTDHANH